MTNSGIVRWKMLSTATNPICSAKRLPPMPPSTALASSASSL